MSLLQKLRSYAMKGNWPKVVEMCNENKELYKSKITGTGDTVLHMAVSDGKVEVVEKMVNFLLLEDKRLAQNNVVVTVVDDEDRNNNEQSWNVKIIIGAENDRKDTPLHIAAKSGKLKICKKIGDIDPSLIVKRNIAGETPIFLAALKGRKNAFLWLHYRYYMESPGVSSTGLPHWKRDNDDTILHCVIAGEKFQVAIEIIHLYKDDLKEMMRRNKEGFSPLHNLAIQRFCFKSTWFLLLPIFLHPIYWLLKVEEQNRATKLEELEKPKKFQDIILVISDSIIFYLGILIFPPSTNAGRTLRLGLRRLKQRSTWAHQIMEELLQRASDEDMSQTISRNISEHLSITVPTQEHDVDHGESGKIMIETPLMIAVKNGVVEMVEKILELFPLTVKDVNHEGKNILLLAVEYRQVEVVKFLSKQKWLSDNWFEQVDNKGNNVLHLVAKPQLRPDDSQGPGDSPLSMLLEWRWFEFVMRSIPGHHFRRGRNREMKRPMQIFNEEHKEQIKTEGAWMAKASQACSVVSTLVVSVAFATRTSVPGGYYDDDKSDNDKGNAILRDNAVFKIFEGSSLGALFLSLISTILLLSVAVSPPQSFDSWLNSPLRFNVGVSFMLASIVCLWTSFCAADFFILDHHTQKLLHKFLPTYTILSLVIILLVVRQSPTFLGTTPWFGHFRDVVLAPNLRTTDLTHIGQAKANRSISKD